jgi:RNase P/RNase MRP subunit p29
MRFYSKKQLLLADEFIGCKIKVLFSPCLSRIGIEGVVIDERKHIFIIQTSRKKVVIPKQYHVFELIFPDGSNVVVKGEDITFRPEERIKKILR